MAYILVFDGYTGYVTVPDSAELSFTNTTQGWTMSVLCRPDVLDFPTTVSSSEGPLVGMLSKKWPEDGAREYEMLIFNKNSQRPNGIYTYFYQPNQSLGAGTYFQHLSMSSGDSGYDPDPLVAGQWLNVTFTIDANKDYIYKNGKLMRCDVYNLSYPSSQWGNCVSPYLSFTPVPGNGPSNLRIGAQNVKWENSSESGLFLGAIKDVRIFNRILTNTEVATLNTDMYNGTNNLSSPNMILWHNYRLGNANDQSGHNNNGTLMSSDSPGGNGVRFVFETIDNITNFISNPTFTLGTPLNWSKYQSGTKAIFKYPEIPGKDGTGSCISTEYQGMDSGKLARWTQTIIIDPTKIYTASGYIKTNNIIIPTGQTGGATIQIDWKDPNGIYINTTFIANNLTGTINWTKFQKTSITPPSNALKATFVLVLKNCTGKVFFDDTLLGY